MPTYTTNSSPIRTNYAVKLFESGLALYTAEVYKRNSPASGADFPPYASGASLGFIPESGIIHDFFVYPTPEVSSSGIPDMLKYHVSAYSRWTDQSVIKKKLVSGKMIVTFSYQTIPEDDVPVRSVVKEYPIFFTQILQTKIIKSGEQLQLVYPEIDFQFASGQNIKVTIPRFSVGNQNFDTEEEANEYAQENGGTLEDTSYDSMEKPLSFFPGMPTFVLNQQQYNGNFSPVTPTSNVVPISINQNNFGEYSEIEIVESSEVSVGTIEGNLIYDFGYYSLIPDPQ